jgi:hypothetical protein
MSQPPSTAASQGPGIEATLDFDPSLYQDLWDGSYFFAKVCPVGGTPTESWFRLAGGTKDSPTQMRCDYRPDQQLIAVFSADTSQGGPAILRDVPVPGRNTVSGRLAVS